MSNLGITQYNEFVPQKQTKVQVSNKKDNDGIFTDFCDKEWSGKTVAKLTGDNIFTDWLQDKDKVCTDGEDDGSLSFKEGAFSLAKGLIGGIPKAMINHPVATLLTVGIGAAATALTGGAILPLLTAAGIVSGVSMAGYGAYKAATAQTDGEAKQALETLGMGAATTGLSVMSAGKALDTAANAGVKSAKVSEDASTLTKVTQLFKSIPESLKVSKNNAKNFLTIKTTKNIIPNKDSAPVTNEDILQLQEEGFYIAVNKKNQVYAYNSENKIIKLGKLGKTKLSTLKMNLRNAQSRGLIVDLTKLDPQKTYVGMQYGVDGTAKGIQICTQKYCPDSEVPTHIFSLVNEKGKWVIYQSNGHATPALGTSAGVNRSNAADWIGLAKNQVKRFEIYEMPLDRSVLHSHMGERYGSGDLVNLFKAFLFNCNGSQGDAAGLMCSEYVALSNPNIQEFYNLPAWCITPAHFKNFVLQNNIPAIK